MAALVLAGILGGGAAAAQDGGWTHWGADERSTRYAPFDQIDAENFEDLEVAWLWRGDNYGPAPDNVMRSTPIYAEGKLFGVAGYRRAVVAMDPATGETLWTFREPPTKRWEDSMRKNYGKGVAYDVVDGEGRIYVVTPGFFLHALDPDTGDLVESFGDGGTVDLLADFGYEHHPTDGLPSTVGYITNSSPPIVVNGVVVVGNSHEQGYRQTRRENVPGHVLAYDAASGEHLWKFNVIPQSESEFGFDTWENDAWRWTGNVSAWAPLSADSERGLVYVVTDPPTNDYWGGFHPGDNLFATSILALDVRTGQRQWHFQTVHHDIWNRDNPTAPNLLDVTIDGRETPILVQTTKQAFAYVFNRETGEPIWPIEERPVPRGHVPGEWYSPTQPFPTKPAAYDLQDVTEDDLIDFTPELRRQALEILNQYEYGSMFTPPLHPDNDLGKRGAIHCPGPGGGTNIWRHRGRPGDRRPLRGVDDPVRGADPQPRRGGRRRRREPDRPHRGEVRHRQRLPAGAAGAAALQAALRPHHRHRHEHRRHAVDDPERGHARQRPQPPGAGGRRPAEHRRAQPGADAGHPHAADVQRGARRAAVAVRRGQGRRRAAGDRRPAGAGHQHPDELRARGPAVRRRPDRRRFRPAARVARLAGAAGVARAAAVRAEAGGRTPPALRAAVA